jgi:hypothetical protein
MSTTWTAVTDRYDNQALVELTQQRDTTTGTVDATVGERAVTAVTALWPVYVQEDYDDTNQGHLELAVEGVIAMLFKWGGTTHRIAQVRWDEWLDFARAWRNTHARARIVPTTNKPDTEVKSPAPSTNYTPWSDKQKFSGLTPGRRQGVDLDSDLE